MLVTQETKDRIFGLQSLNQGSNSSGNGSIKKKAYTKLKTYGIKFKPY